jgi:hypothetical protein
VQVPPDHPEAQAHIFGFVHAPPLAQVGEQTAKQTHDYPSYLTTQVKQPRSLTIIYGLIRPSRPYFTVTLRVTWLRITAVFLRIVYDKIRSSTGTKELLLIIIVHVLLALLRSYIVYGPKRSITEIVCDRKRLYISVYDTEKYDRNTEPCNTAKYGRIRSVF